MKRKSINQSFFIAFLIAALASPCWTWAADAPKEVRPKLYDESADGSKQITDALVIARKNDKHVLLQFGANWCAPCLKLHKLFESDKSVSEELRANYVVVLIDRNKEHNKDLAVKYGAEYDFGLPFLVVLDSDGKHLTTKNTEELEEGDHHSPQKVLALLHEWTPKVFAARQAALRAKPIVQWVEEFVETRQYIGKSIEFEQIRNKADEAVPALIHVIRADPGVRGSKDHRRIRAYEALGALGPLARSAVPFLTEEFTTNNHLVGFASATLPKLGPEAKLAVPTLRNILHDPELIRVVQESAERSDPRSYLLFHAARCLSKVDPAYPQLIPTMLVWLKSPNVFCRRVAPGVLGQLGSAAKPATPALIQALADADETVRQNAADAIAKIDFDAGSGARSLK